MQPYSYGNGCRRYQRPLYVFFSFFFSFFFSYPISYRLFVGYCFSHFDYFHILYSPYSIHFLLPSIDLFIYSPFPIENTYIIPTYLGTLFIYTLFIYSIPFSPLIICVLLYPYVWDTVYLFP
jgi:hypothetical protein